MAPDPNPLPTGELSLAQRLARIYGEGIDPRIDLAPDKAPQPAESRTDSTADPAAQPTLQRLGTRRVAARRYRLQREVARGGMGSILEVFDEDLRRRLAMKVILERQRVGDQPPSIDPAALARFLEEAQVTGQLDHPGVVPVHELGIDEAGRVYFTMRLVEGRDLEAIFALAARGEEGWSVTRVLSVLLKVCEAMAYAHDKGVVHRDLKPANVMVGRFGEVYVMDWGLARVLSRAEPGTGQRRAAPSEQVATDRRESSSLGMGDALQTTEGDVLGTPSYMPPEQARGELDAVDTRADVYAVGAMLYHLLAGAPPYTKPGERGNGVDVWRRVLAGPPESIERVATAAPAELQAICTKAMQRAPADRYAHMLALADDLRAFLEGRVVQAFETGAWATARKWLLRNRKLAAALAAAVLALVGGLAASLAFAARAEASAKLAETRRVEADGNAKLAEQRRQEAVANSEAAARQARVAEAVNSFLNDDLLAAIKPEELGKDVTVRQVLDLSAQRLDGRFGEEPQIESALRITIGMSYQRLGAHAEAVRHLQRARELRQQTDGPRSEPVLVVLRGLGAALGAAGRPTEAIATYEEAVDIARKVLGAEQRGTLSTMNDLASQYGAVGRKAEARKLYETILPIMERTLGTDAPDTVATRNNLVLLEVEAGRASGAEAEMREVLAERRATYGDEHPETQTATINLAALLSELGQFDEAERLVRATLALRREQLDAGHPLLIRTLGTLGTIQQRRGQMPEAEATFRQALADFEQAPQQQPQDQLWLQHSLAATLVGPERRAEVLELRRAVLAGREALLAADHPQVCEARTALAQVLGDSGRFDEALALHRTSVAALEPSLGVDHPQTLTARENLGATLFAKGDYAENETLLVELLAARQRVQGDRHPDVANTAYNLASVQRRLGNLQAAQESAEHALALATAVYGDRHRLTADCHQLLGDLAIKAERFPAAITSFEEAARIRRTLRPNAPLPPSLLHQLGLAQLRNGQFATAEATFATALANEQAASGKDSLAIRACLLGHANTLVELGRLAEAEAEALDLLERAQRANADADFIARVRKLLVRVFEAAGRPEEAAKWR